MESLTKERANRILNLMKFGKDETMIFEEDNYDYEHTLIVGEEFHRLEKEIDEKITECKNESELSKKLTSDLLNPKEVIKTVIRRRFAENEDADFKTLKIKL